MKKYLFFVSLSYSYSILRPIQDEIRRRGDDAAWFIEESCPVDLQENEKQLKTIQEVMKYNPIAVFAPGNYVYDFFPGIKVQVFHGYAMNKRADKIDDHFTIRGWFDIYCTQGPSSTPYFKELERKYKFFKVYETGWSKVDTFFSAPPETPRENPVILYSPTFSKNITSAYLLYSTIEKIIEEKPWEWIITFHPKLDDPDLIAKYKGLTERYNNKVAFHRSNDGLNTFRKIDVMLCDSSSIIVEVEMLNKPVVTFRNTTPGPYLIDVLKEEDVCSALETAITRPPQLMKAIEEYTMFHEVHRDGRNSARVLDAVDDFIDKYKGKIKKKPLNLIRKLKVRKKIGYFPFGPRYKSKD